MFSYVICIYPLYIQAILITLIQRNAVYNRRRATVALWGRPASTSSRPTMLGSATATDTLDLLLKRGLGVLGQGGNNRAKPTSNPQLIQVLFRIQERQASLNQHMVVLTKDLKSKEYNNKMGFLQKVVYEKPLIPAKVLYEFYKLLLWCIWDPVKQFWIPLLTSCVLKWVLF